MGPSELSSPSKISVTAAAAAILATGILLHQRNSLSSWYRRRRGVAGLLRLLWIGDHLPPSVRRSMDELDKVEARMVKSEEQFEQIDIMIERARLESVDGSTTSPTTPAAAEIDGDEWKAQLFRLHPELRTRIGIFSNKLDTLAAIIDSVKSHSDEEVKRRKKQFSNRIVELMEKLDRTVASLDLNSEGR